jgi:ABC-type Fe3+-hydroxamate transport system substrate-binding protein
MEYIDQMGRKLQLSSPPQRIISLVPSQTELLFDLGLEEEVVGITKFCVHPEAWFRSKTRVGGTKEIHFDRIKALQADLIIGNKEENTKEMIEALEKDYPVWMSDIYNLQDAFEMMLQIGAITNTFEKAKQIQNQLQSNFEQLSNSKATAPKVAYFIWQKPMMIAAKNTFIDEMLKAAGYQNAFPHLERYPEISEAELQEAKPDLIFLSSEPFPFKEKHIKSYQKFCPKAKVLIVNGELFSWYGSRLLKSVEYFKKLEKELESI